jgi:histidine triad (HIT) family protein
MIDPERRSDCCSRIRVVHQPINQTKVHPSKRDCMVESNLEPGSVYEPILFPIVKKSETEASMTLESSCIFCQIISGEAQASLVYKDGSVTAFMDIQPLVQGHLLVIPNDHVASLDELDEKTGAHMFSVACNLAQAIRCSDLRCEGVNLFLADGAPAGQTVFHCHLHVIPRFIGDGFRIHFPSDYDTLPSREELDHIASKFKNSLSGIP